MSVNRRLAARHRISIAWDAAPRSISSRAESPSDFDPVATAKLRAGEIVREIVEADVMHLVRRPARDELLTTGLLLQAG